MCGRACVGVRYGCYCPWGFKAVLFEQQQLVVVSYACKWGLCDEPVPPLTSCVVCSTHTCYSCVHTVLLLPTIATR